MFYLCTVNLDINVVPGEKKGANIHMKSTCTVKFIKITTTPFDTAR